MLICNLYDDSIIDSDEKKILKKEIIRKDIPLLNIFNNYFDKNQKMDKFIENIK